MNEILNIAEKIAQYDDNIKLWLDIYRNGTNKIKIDGIFTTYIPPKSRFALKNLCVALKLRANNKVFSRVQFPENIMRMLSRVTAVDCESIAKTTNTKEVIYMKIVKDIPKSSKTKWNLDPLIAELQKLGKDDALQATEKELKELIGVDSKNFLKSLRTRLNKLGYSVSVHEDNVYIYKK